MSCARRRWENVAAVQPGLVSPVFVGRGVELAGLMDALDSGAGVLTGSCIELGGRGLPLSPVVDALRR